MMVTLGANLVKKLWMSPRITANAHVFAFGLESKNFSPERQLN